VQCLSAQLHIPELNDVKIHCCDSIILWHVDPLLCNDHETTSCTASLLNYSPVNKHVCIKVRERSYNGIYVLYVVCAKVLLPGRVEETSSHHMTCVTKTMTSGWRLESKLCSKLMIETPQQE
jgi:hypothetical protein